MKTAVIFDHLLNQSVAINIYEKTGFSPGNRVTHKNEGHKAGSSGLIKVGLGEVLSVDFSGEDMFGRQVYIAQVRWQSGETFTLNISLLKKIAQ